MSEGYKLSHSLEVLVNIYISLIELSLVTFLFTFFTFFIFHVDIYCKACVLYTQVLA